MKMSEQTNFHETWESLQRDMNKFLSVCHTDGVELVEVQKTVKEIVKKVGKIEKMWLEANNPGFKKVMDEFRTLEIIKNESINRQKHDL